MQEHYSKVCRQLLEYYPNFLTEREILSIKKIIKLNNYDNINIIIFLNKLIDRIWQMTLTNPDNYQEGEAFVFLTISNIFPSNLSDIDGITKNSKHFLTIITDKSLIKTSSDTRGFIVEIDYINSFSEPILPIDFQNDISIGLKSKLNIKGLYNVSLNIGNFQASEQLMNNFSDISGYKLINLNKPLYNQNKNQPILNKTDLENLISEIIINYMVDRKLSFEIPLKDELIKKYQNLIIKQYSEYFNKKISLEEFILSVYNEMDKELKNEIIDKSM